MVKAGALNVLHVLLVHDCEVARHAFLGGRLAYRLAEHVTSEALVHEALALAVHPQAGRGAPGAEGHARRIAGNGARMALDGAASPAAHLVAAAVAVGHAPEGLAGNAVAHGVLGAELPHHVGVAAEVTRSQNDALGGVELGVGAVLGLGDDARHGAGLVEHALNAGHGAEPLSAKILGGIAAIGLNLGHARNIGETGMAYRLLVLRAVGLERGSPHLVAGALDGIAGSIGGVIGNLNDALAAVTVEERGGIRRDGHEVVHHLAGVVDEAADDRGVAATVGATHVLVRDLIEVVRAKAPALKQLGVVGADIIAAVDDNDVKLLGLGDIGRGNLGSLAEPVLVAHIVDHGHRVHGLGGICGRGATLGVRGLVVGQGDRGGGHAGNGGAGGCDERTTGEFHVARSLSSRVLMRPHVSVLGATALRTRAAQSGGRRWFQHASATRRIAFRWAFKYGRKYGPYFSTLLNAKSLDSVELPK